MKSTDTGLDTDKTERILAERRNEAVPVAAEGLERLREDSARLDFLEVIRATVYESSNVESDRHHHRVVVNERQRDRRGCLGKTLREAIDDAIKTSK